MCIRDSSLLCVEDALDGLRWTESIGGLPELVRRTQANLAVLKQWETASEWIAFLPARREIRSSTSICLRIADAWFAGLTEAAQRAKVKALVAKLENEGVAYDINGYRAAPPGLRIWGGATVETSDIEALVPVSYTHLTLPTIYSV